MAYLISIEEGVIAGIFDVSKRTPQNPKELKLIIILVSHNGSISQTRKIMPLSEKRAKTARRVYVRLLHASLIAAFLSISFLQARAVTGPASTTTRLILTYGGGQTNGQPGEAASIPYDDYIALAGVVTSPSGVVLPGQVRFCEIGVPDCAVSPVGIAQLTPDGTNSAVAVLTIQPGPGRHVYTATFLGTSSFAASTAAAQTLTVSLGVQTATTLTFSGSTGNYALNATVTPTSPTPLSGTVTFLDTVSKIILGSKTVASIPVVTLSSSTAYDTGTEPSSVITGDFNGDGLTDIAFLNTNSPGGSETHSVSVLLARQHQTFQPIAALSVPDASAIAAGDLNNDGILDLVVAQPQHNGSNSAPGKVLTLLGNGNGTFRTGNTVTIADGPSFIAVGDFNGDGNADLAVTSTYYTGATAQQSVVSVLVGNGQGGFTTGSSNTVGYNADKVVALDFNGDGKLDFAVTNSGASAYVGSTLTMIAPGSVALMLGNGDGTFTAGTSPFTAAGITNNDIYAGDFDGDGKTDLLVPTNYSGQYRVLFGNGDATFRSAADFHPDTAYSRDAGTPIFITDLNRDGKSDLVFADFNALKLLTGNGDGTFTEASSVPGAITHPDYYAVAGADFNQDGVPDIVTVNSDTLKANVFLTLSRSTGTAQLTGVSIAGAGSHAITATYNGDPGNAASTSNAINLTGTQIATTLKLTASPTQAGRGAQVLLQATLSPSSSGSLTSDGGPVDFKSNGTLLKEVPLAGGIATLNTTTLPDGANTITATFVGTSDFASSTSSPVTVTVSVNIPATAPTLTPSTLAFGSQSVGSATAAQTVTLKNTAAVPLTITSITAGGDFSQTNTCGSTVAAGATCTISVVYTPSAVGSVSGTLTIVDNAPGSPQTVALSGTGVAPAIVITPPSGTFIVNTSGSTTLGLLIAPPAGFTGAVTLTCKVNFKGTGTSANPPGCRFAPTTVNVSNGASGSTVLTLTTGTATTSVLEHLGRGAGAVLAGTVLVIVGSAKRRFRGALLALLCTVMLGFAAGCGGSSNTTATTGSSTATTAGSYSVTVTATAGATTSTVDIPFTVQSAAQ